MDAINKLKSEVSLVEHIWKYLTIGKTEKTKVFFHSSEKDKTASLCVWVNNEKWYKDFSWVYGAGTIIDFHKHYRNIESKEATIELLDMYGFHDKLEKKTFKKAPKRFELVTEFEKYRMKKMTHGFKKFLGTRGLSFEDINDMEEELDKIAQDYGYCENLGVWDKVFTDVIIFPCYDLDKDGKKYICGAKIRRCDGEKIWGRLKSVAIGKPKPEVYDGDQEFSTWLWFWKISKKYLIVTEGETDELILKILGFSSVVGNYWGVESNSARIQKHTKGVDKIVVLYDNDIAGTRWIIWLQEKIWRPIRKVVYPQIDWLDKYDINDLYNQGYRKEEFKKLIANSVLLDEKQLQNEQDRVDNNQQLYKGRFFFDNTKLEYFDTKSMGFIKNHILADFVGVKPWDLRELRENQKIPIYEGVCYYDWGRKGYYNLLDRRDILTPSKTPAIHEDIFELITNLCNNKEINYMWLLEAIAYKYTHLNDPYIGAIVFHGMGSTWKGLLLKLLSTIFWEDNIQIGLNQDSMDSSFSVYSGGKLIVEYKEISVDGTRQGKKNLNKLKSIIMEDKIMVRKMHRDAFPVDNIALFIMSSNEAKPLQLDNSHTGNRRFNIIATWQKIPQARWKEIEQTITNVEHVRNFLAYLMEEFPDIQKQQNIRQLNNKDKRDVEDLSDSPANKFFKWMEEKFPDVKHFTIQDREDRLGIYRSEVWEDSYTMDNEYKPSYFNNWLSVRYKLNVVNKDGKATRCYSIVDKDIWTAYGFIEKKDKKSWLPKISSK